MMKIYYVYILQCSDGTFYTGVTNNLERRLQQHNVGINKTCYTFKRRPLKLVFHEKYIDINLAISWEKKLKKWSAKKKKVLIDKNYHLLLDLAKKQF